ncbi:hypothetical protein LINPERPRIM_LOCUS29537 [Linum perenne]
MDGDGAHNNDNDQIGSHVAVVEHGSIRLDRRPCRDAIIRRHNSALSFPPLPLLPISSSFARPFSQSVVS